MSLEKTFTIVVSDVVEPLDITSPVFSSIPGVSGATGTGTGAGGGSGAGGFNPFDTATAEHVGDTIDASLAESDSGEQLQFDPAGDETVDGDQAGGEVPAAEEGRKSLSEDIEQQSKQFEQQREEVLQLFKGLARQMDCKEPLRSETGN
jgi:hypothetical protein